MTVHPMMGGKIVRWLGRWGRQRRGWQRWAWLPTLLVTVLVVAGCAPAAPPVVSASVAEAMSAPAGETFARAYEPRDFVFPLDHGAHPEYRTEWWYYTGNLQDAAGRPYGYQLTFFRTAIKDTLPPRTSDLATNQVYMAHFALTDGPRQEHESFDRYSRGAGGLAGASGDPLYQVWLEDWSAREVSPGVQRLIASAPGAQGEVAIDLTLRETREPVLHGDRGLHQKGPEPGNASYYYSLVGLESSGVITSAEQAIPVTGLSWMDHEFGTSALSGKAIGWDWFSMQLDNGAALMLYTIRTSDGSPAPDLYGTIAWPDGRQQTVTHEEFTITPAGEWTSPRTGFTYPSGWTIAIPGLDVALKVDPLIPDQEMAVQFVYWEGAVNVSGTWAGQPVAGRGYVELTGYGDAPSGAYQR